MSASTLAILPFCTARPARTVLSTTQRGIAVGLIAALIWGSYMAFSHHGIAAGLMPSDLAFIRYTTAGLILLPWLLRHAPLQLGGIGWRKGLALSALAGPLFVLVGTSGYRFAPLAHGAVIQRPHHRKLPACIGAQAAVRSRNRAGSLLQLGWAVNALNIADAVCRITDNIWNRRPSMAHCPRRNRAAASARTISYPCGP